nr:MAG TPA: hypothetical protein [Caudoviricetes sp.]
MRSPYQAARRTEHSILRPLPCMTRARGALS